MTSFNPIIGIMNSWIFFPILVWTVFWKGFALWTAAHKNHKVWFVVLLIVNTFGILEIIYLFWIAKKNWGDVKRILEKIFVPKKR